jgi:hypothetical protein
MAEGGGMLVVGRLLAARLSGDKRVLDPCRTADLEKTPWRGKSLIFSTQYEVAMLLRKS